MEEVHELLSKAYSKSSHTEALTVLKELDRFLDTVENPVDKIMLKKTRKISQKFGYSLYGQIPRLYIKYLKLVDRKNTDLLINLCNDSLLIRDTLIGTEIGENISVAVREALIYMVQQGSLDSQQSVVVQGLLEVKQTVNFEEELGYAIEEIEANSSVGLHIMIDLFSTFSSQKDQFYYFSTQISPLIKSLNTKRSVEIYSLTIKFLEILLPVSKFVVKINEEICEYQLSYLKLFPQYEDVFYTSLEIVKVLMKTDRYINENCVRVLCKLWNLYPGLRNQLYEMIVANFKVISASNSYDSKRKAAEFLFMIMHDKSVDGDFKGMLESEGLDNLFDDESYDKVQLNPVDVKDLKVNAGYPICVEIKPGEKMAYYVEVTEPSSILTWGFATEDYDITYKVCRMNTVEEVMFQGERIPCDTTPVLGSLFIDVPGLYKFEWNNTFSWFRSKKIRFRICTLIPIQSPPDPVQNSKISILNPDEIGDLCYNLPNIECTEIGISLSSSSLSTFTTLLDTFPLSDSENVSEKISRIISSIKGKNKKIGIVSNKVISYALDYSLGCFAVCRDIDAFALLNHDTLQVNTLIAVIDSDGIRSSVVLDGKLFHNGDVKNLKNQEPAVAVATLLGMFGPGTVVVHGVDIEKLVARARLMVPVGIWNNSQVVFSSFSLAECASRMHYLAYRYKTSL